MKKYEKPAMAYFAVSAAEDMAALLEFDDLKSLSPNIYSYLTTSAKTFGTGTTETV